jgi:hypothetical protein
VKRYHRVNGEYLGTCACGCGEAVYERLYLYPTGGIGMRDRPRFIEHHSLRVNHKDRTGIPSRARYEARRALILPLGLELDALIHRRRQELGLSSVEMHALLGWKGRNNLHRYKFKPNVMRSTLNRTLDSLYADEGGWVEADKLWALVRERQAYWGMTDTEMSAVLQTTEALWIGKATARRILLALTGSRRPCEFEQIRTQRETACHQRAEYRAKAIERQAS